MAPVYLDPCKTPKVCIPECYEDRTIGTAKQYGHEQDARASGGTIEVV